MARTRRVSRKKFQLPHLPQNDSATFHGLHEWYCHIFEKVGWMVLAKARGNSDKLHHYMRSIDHLEASIRARHAIIEEKDRKHDLEIMLRNTQALRTFVHNTL